MNRKSTLHHLGERASGTLRAAAGAAIVTLAAAAPAQATVIDFNDYFTLVGHGDSFDEDGYRLTGLSNHPGAAPGDLVGAIFDGADCDGGACPAGNATPYYGAIDDGVLLVEAVNATSFRIGSFDASFMGNNATSFPFVSGLLRIQGVRADHTFAIETYQLAGPSNGAFQFAHYDTTSFFGSQDFVAAFFFGYACDFSGSCSAFSTDRGQFGIDNIALAAAVPEPATGLIFGLGLASLCACARRRSAETPPNQER